MSSKNPEPIEHPKHYTEHPSGVECWDLTSQLNANLANAVKYVYRRHSKNDLESNIKKAVQYLHKEITDIDKQRAAGGFDRFFVQPGQYKAVKNYIEMIRRHEKREINDFYRALDELAPGREPVPAMILIGRMAGALLLYLDRRPGGCKQCGMMGGFHKMDCSEPTNTSKGGE